MQVRARLRVNSDDVGPGLGEVGDKGIDRRDHQVHVERQLGMAAQRLDHLGPDGDVGDKVAIHHVDMDVVRAGARDRPDLGAQTGEIRRQDGRGNTNLLLHDLALFCQSCLRCAATAATTVTATVMPWPVPSPPAVRPTGTLRRAP